MGEGIIGGKEGGREGRGEGNIFFRFWFPLKTALQPLALTGIIGPKIVGGWLGGRVGGWKEGEWVGGREGGKVSWF